MQLLALIHLNSPHHTSAAVTGKEVLLLHYIPLLVCEPPWSTCGLLQIKVKCSTRYKVKADDFLSKGT